MVDFTKSAKKNTMKTNNIGLKCFALGSRKVETTLKMNAGCVESFKQKQ